MRPIIVTWIVALVACSGSEPEPDASADGRFDTRPLSQDSAPDQRSDTLPCTLVEPYSSKNASCNACAEANCCPEINGCVGDPECNDAYVNCTLVCALSDIPDAGIDPCLDQCAQDHPTGKAEYDVAIGCAETLCVAECS